MVQTRKVCKANLDIHEKPQICVYISQKLHNIYVKIVYKLRKIRIKYIILNQPKIQNRSKPNSQTH